MKTLLISTALFTVPLVGSVTAQTTTGTLTKLVSEQERQIQELKSEVSSLRSLLNLERRNNGKAQLSSTNSSIETKSSSTISHTIKAGDTFSSVSRKYGVSVSSLIISNPSVKPSQIAIGQKLVIPRANSKAIASAPKAKETPVKPISLSSYKTQTISTNGSYKVAKGDTFYGIAKKHGISLAALSSANPSVNPNKLKIGQTVNLTKSASSSQTMKSSKPSNTKKTNNAYKPLPKVVKTETKPVSKPQPKKAESYVQQSGKVARTIPVSKEMTFGAFAKQHGTTISVLNTLNGLDLPADEPMAAGSELFIPNN